MVLRCLGLRAVTFLKKLCIQFYKIILNAKKSTPHIILYGELGRYPISTAVNSRMVGGFFWQWIIDVKHVLIIY